MISTLRDLFSRHKAMAFLMSIPSSFLLCLFVMRFVNQESMKNGTSPAAFHPDNKIELDVKQKSNLERMQSDLEIKQKQVARQQKSLVSLDFQRVTNTILPSINQRQTGGNGNEGEAVRKWAGNAENYTEEKGKKSRAGTNFDSKPNVSVFSASRPARRINVSNDRQEGSKSFGGADFNGFSKEEGQSEMTKKEAVSSELKAFVLGDQEIVNGSKVKFRTSEKTSIGSQIIPKNTIFLASARFERDRLMLFVHQLGQGQDKIDVHMVCRDEDNKQGIVIAQKANGWSEPVDAGKSEAISQISSASPVGSGVISQVGRKLFHSNKEKPFPVTDGMEIYFTTD